MTTTSRDAVSPPGTVSPRGTVKLAVLVSRFPKVTETFVLFEVLALPAHGIDVEVYSLMRHDGAVRHPEVATLDGHVHYLPFLSLRVCWDNLSFFCRHPWRYVRSLTRVLRATVGSANFFFGGLAVVPKTVSFALRMQRDGIQHIHAHFANHPTFAAWLVYELVGIPYSFIGHGSDVHVDQHALASKINRAAFALTVSDYNREFLREEIGSSAADKLRIHHCGVETNLFQPGQERPAGPVRIVCVASLRTVKGHRFLIEACRLLHERGVPFTCFFVGDGPRKQDLQLQIQEAGLSKQIELLGDQPRQEVLKALQTADIATLCSAPDADGRREGIPVSLMEAMSCGLPVVASRLSGIPELVEDQQEGLLVTPGDPGEIAAALERLATDREFRLKLGAAARLKVQESFAMDKQVAALAELLHASVEKARLPEA